MQFVRHPYEYTKSGMDGWQMDEKWRDLRRGWMARWINGTPGTRLAEGPLFQGVCGLGADGAKKSADDAIA